MPSGSWPGRSTEWVAGRRGFTPDRGLDRARPGRPVRWAPRRIRCGGSGPRLHLRAGIWEVTAGLGQARFRAIMSGEPVRVRFVPSGFVFERYDEAAGAWRPARTAVLSGVTVRANNAPVFHPQGTVSGAGHGHGGQRAGELQDHGGDNGQDPDGQ
ncbi:MAG: hypothetical protein MZU91_10595, partial [Desulfosudis oleivorans]|nr:hypothetical protein [Desulfosudis oleivorans]